MKVLQSEIESIQNNNYRLKFRIPTDVGLADMRKIHRDRAASRDARKKEAERGLRSYIEALESGDVTVSELAPELRTAVARHLGEPFVDSR